MGRPSAKRSEDAAVVYFACGENLMYWRKLSRNPSSLSDARLQLHHAAQLVSGVGRSFLEARPDDSHTAMTWSQRDGALVGKALDGWRASLAFGPAELRLSDQDGERSGFALASATLKEAEQWLLTELSARTGRALGDSLKPLHYEIPDHAVGRGGTFSEPDSAFVELESWYSDAQSLLEQINVQEPNTTAISCWPHHFDIALLIELDRGRAVEQPRTIGVGMSPGDETYDQPYLYVGPYPRPASSALPYLTDGHWRTEGAFNAVLLGRDVVAEDAGADRADLSLAFLQEAVAASKEMLEES